MSNRFASFSSSKKMGVTLETINRFQLSINEIEEGHCGPKNAILDGCSTKCNRMGLDANNLIIILTGRVDLSYSLEAIFKEL